MPKFEAKWERADPDDPNRCQAINQQGQCNLKAIEGSQYCPAHGGNKAYESKQKQELRNYRLAKFKQRAIELGNSEHITSLRDEVAILRMLVEEKVNQCNDTQELMLISGPLADLMMKVEKVVVSCNRLESKLGNLLDRAKVLQFAQIIIEIISTHCSEDILNKVAEEIEEALNSI